MSQSDLPIQSPLPGTSLSSMIQARPTAPAQGADVAANEKAAKSFESVLMTKLLDEMRRTIPQSDLLEGGGAAQQTQDIFWMYLGQDLGNRGGLGLWKDLARQMNAASTPAPSLEQLR